MSGTGPVKTGWAGGRPRGLLGTREPAVLPEPAARPEAAARPEPGAATVTTRGDLAGAWAPVIGRVALGLVLLWFGYHELEHPGAWTGYVPVISETSTLAIVAVLVHGWVLFVLGIALVAGIEPRLAASLASVILLEIVISLVVSGLTDTALRDVGVLGLAVCLTGVRDQRLTLRG